MEMNWARKMACAMEREGVRGWGHCLGPSQLTSLLLASPSFLKLTFPPLLSRSGSIIHYKNMAGQAEAGAKLYAGANQAVSDAFSSIRVIHSYSLKQEVSRT
jgi:hypothetical protein